MQKSLLVRQCQAAYFPEREPHQILLMLLLLVPGKKYAKARGVKRCWYRGLRPGVRRGSMGRNLSIEKVIFRRNTMKTVENFVMVVDFINKGS